MVGPFDKRLGDLAYAYALREAYPGAIYYYMARPYRVISFSYKDGAIRVRPEKRWTTIPTSRVKVFPKFPDGILSQFVSGDSMVIESEMQVSEQVTGFTEKRGPNKEHHTYDQNSEYWQRSLTRFFRTTGVCFQFPDITLLAGSLHVVLEAFCGEFGVQERDLGLGEFFSKINVSGAVGTLRGYCIYDATNGSLRLTEQLALNFRAIVSVARELAERRGEAVVGGQLQALQRIAGSLEAVGVPQGEYAPLDDGWIEVICPGERGIYSSDGGRRDEIEIENVRYTPRGAVYDVKTSNPSLKQSLGIRTVEPMFGMTKICLWNPETGEMKSKE